MQSQVTCWVVTDGRAGMENQCLGLAEALELQPVIKRVRLRHPWHELSPYLCWGAGMAYSSQGDAVRRPWPDLLIASGRASIPAATHIRQASRRQGRPTMTVHIQNPRIDPALFDLVVTPRHDNLLGANVMTTLGGLHRLTPERLQQAAAEWAPHFAQLPRPYILAIIGGSNSVYQLTPAVMARIAMQLNRLAQETGGSILVTPSRRTGEANRAILAAGLNNVPHIIYDMTGPNPYFGMLGLADYVLVTTDSVNLASEACTTGKPVMILDLPGGSDKFRQFHATLRQGNYTRPFTGQLESWPHEPLNEMPLVAARVRDMMELR